MLTPCWREHPHRKHHRIGAGKLSFPALFSALGQFQLDAAVAALGGVVFARVERLMFAEAGGGQPIGRNSLVDHEFDHGDGAGGGEFPVGGELRRLDRHMIGMAIDAQDPGQISRHA